MNIFKRKKSRNEAIIDLGKLNLRQAEQSTSEQANVSTVNDNFLGVLATAATTQSSIQPSTENFPSQAIHTNNPEIAERFEKLTRRMNNIIERLDLIEHKISRLEHRVDLKY